MIESPDCPKCGARMLKREGRNSKTGRNFCFWGCSTYKKTGCKGQVPYTYNTVKVNTVAEPKTDYRKVTLNPRQQAFLDAYINESCNLILQAGPGTGKTFTALMACHYAPVGISIVFLSFDKETKTRNAAKAPEGVDVATINSNGRSNILRVFGKTFTDSCFNQFKVNDIFKAYLDANYMKGEDGYKKFRQNMNSMVKVVNLMRAMVETPSEEMINNLILKNSLTFTVELELVHQLITDAFWTCYEDKTTYDYDDQILWVVYGYIKPLQYDMVMVDEVQDITEMQIEYLQMIIKDNGRIIMVGDQNQSIYVFRGVRLGVMEDLKKLFKAKELPLDITRRIPKAGVAFLNSMFPDIPLVADESAIEGSVNYISNNQFVELVEEGDMVLCRNNAPLCAPAFSLIKAGKKAMIKGRDIGENLVAHIDKIVYKFKCDSIDTLIESAIAYRDNEVSILQKMGASIDTIIDKTDCILSLSEGVDDIEELISNIKRIFDDNKSGVMFSSVHKAKGDESKNVFVLEPQLMPSSKAVTDEDVEQEKHVMWVAYSREKENLYIVASKGK